jgi:putative flavoprotein involved in K+ transport
MIGTQIACELANAGRDVTVAIGKHGWVPRRVYGRDQMWWRWDNGNYHAIVADPDRPKADYPFTFLARWGVSDFNVRTVWQAGARLAGHLVGVDGAQVRFEAILKRCCGRATREGALRRVRPRLRAPRGERAGAGDRGHWRDGEIETHPTRSITASAGIRTVIWSTGYRQDFSWIRVPGILATNGAPYQRRGVSRCPHRFVGFTACGKPAAARCSAAAGRQRMSGTSPLACARAVELRTKSAIGAA